MMPTVKAYREGQERPIEKIAEGRAFCGVKRSYSRLYYSY